MRAVIVTEGGHSIGLGHVTRCISLAQALERYGAQVMMVVHGDEAASRIIGARPAEFFDWMVDNRRLKRLVDDVDIAVIDSYLAGSNVYEAVASAVKVAGYIDDTCRIDYPMGVVINGAIGAEKLEYHRNQGVRYLVGPSYIPLRAPFWGAGEKKVRQTMERALVTCGGVDKDNLTLALLTSLTAMYPMLEKRVVTGEGYIYSKDLNAAKDKKTSIIINASAEEMKKQMEESDIAIAAGGQTLYELAACGVPTIGIMVAENQRYNVAGWQGVGFLKDASPAAGCSERIPPLIKALASPEERRKSSKAGQRLVDGHGAIRVAEALIEAANRSG